MTTMKASACTFTTYTGFPFTDMQHALNTLKLAKRQNRFLTVYLNGQKWAWVNSRYEADHIPTCETRLKAANPANAEHFAVYGKCDEVMNAIADWKQSDARVVLMEEGREKRYIATNGMTVQANYDRSFTNGTYNFNTVIIEADKDEYDVMIRIDAETGTVVWAYKKDYICNKVVYRPDLGRKVECRFYKKAGSMTIND